MGLSTNNNNGHGIIYVGHCNSLAGGLVTFCLLDESSLMSFQNGLSDSFLSISALTSSRIALLWSEISMCLDTVNRKWTCVHCFECNRRPKPVCRVNDKCGDRQLASPVEEGTRTRTTC